MPRTVLMTVLMLLMAQQLLPLEVLLTLLLEQWLEPGWRSQLPCPAQALPTRCYLPGQAQQGPRLQRPLRL